MRHLIVSVEPGSIAGETEISPGDFLLSVNGKDIADVFDYRYETREETVLLEIEKPDGEIWELEIEKDEDEDLGLMFENALMDRARECRNKCVFCFIDQMPPQMRETLYFKDDDPRLSFMTGNYITLTNITRAEAERIAYYHLSPMRISVHAAEPDLRVKLMGNPAAGNLFETLEIFNAAGITMHFQVVLCRGLNDGEHLNRTIGWLLRFRPGAASLSVVPAGLTRYREGLHPLEQFTPGEAAEVISLVEGWQRRCLAEAGTAFVFCADEFYLLAGLPLPDYEHYEDFPQLENGVGMLALFKREFDEAAARANENAEASILVNKDGDREEANIRKCEHALESEANARSTSPAAKARGKKIGIVTGRAAGGFMRELTRPFKGVTVYEVENNFFGPLITVSGLLTGGDVIAQIKSKISEDNIDALVMPKNAFRAGTEQMLDGVTRDELCEQLGVPVIIGSPDGGEFYKNIFLL